MATIIGVNAVTLDRDAVRRLYEEHGRGLIAYACAFLQGFSAAEDVLHQVFQRLLQGNVEIQESPISYIYRAVRNASINYVRDRSRDTELDDGWLESAADMKDAAIVLESALRELPAEQREIIVLHVWGQLSFEEAAETVGISPKTAASR